MYEDNVVFVKSVTVIKHQLTEIIDVLNKHELVGEILLTYDEVISNPRLLDYICNEAIEDGDALFNPFDFWNDDGWCNFRDYRN